MEVRGLIVLCIAFYLFAFKKVILGIEDYAFKAIASFFGCDGSSILSSPD